MAQNKTVVDMSMYQQHAGAGMENVRREDLGVPLLVILQALSPQLKPRNAKYVEGAKENMVMETASKRLWDTEKDPIIFIPCGFDKFLVEWKPRKSGGGLVRAHDINSPILGQCTQNEKGVPCLPNGNEIKETAYHSGLIVDGKETIQVIIPMTSTQLKNSRGWLNLQNGIRMDDGKGGKFQPPSFAFSYVLTVREENRDDNTWGGWHIALGEQVKDVAVFQKAIEAHKSLSAAPAALRAQQAANQLAVNNEEEEGNDPTL